MQFFPKALLLAIAATFLTTTAANPVSNAPELRAPLLKRAALTGAWACVDANWKGQCFHLMQAEGQCRDVSSEFGKKITAFGPDGKASCDLYTTKDCTGQSFNLVYPGTPNVGEKWNDKVLSFRCK